jgi:hypothetical protein
VTSETAPRTSALNCRESRASQGPFPASNQTTRRWRLTTSNKRRTLLVTAGAYATRSYDLVDILLLLGGAVLVPAWLAWTGRLLIGAPLSWVQRMTSDRPVAPVGRGRCRKRGAHARDPGRLGRGLVSKARHHGVPRRGPLSLRVRQMPGNDSDEAKFHRTTPLRHVTDAPARGSDPNFRVDS